METEIRHATILGAGGAIGTPLAAELLAQKIPVRLVSRSGVSQTGAETVRADLTSWEQTARAVNGSHTVFLCAGLAYDAKVWGERWPIVMTNAIEACKAHDARLVFLDNVYMYGRVAGPMTETTPIAPCSRKGAIRARLAAQLMDAVEQEGLTALIARAADFYGPHATRSSVLNLLVIDPLRKGNRARWLVNADVPHAFSYTPDVASALVRLAGEPGAFGQVWHVPTCSPAPTGRAFVEMVAREVGVKPAVSVLSKWMIRLAGLTDRNIRESYEMLYQNEFAYEFDSGKYERAFGVAPTSYEAGIAETLRHLAAADAAQRERGAAGKG